MSKISIVLGEGEPKDKSKFLTPKGNVLTQSLFLELGYHKAALYSLTSEEDKEYKGKIYPSLKRIYMEYAYPGGLRGEYDFALHAFYSWKQWLRVAANGLIKDTIDEWRLEREFKAQSESMRILIDEVDMGGTAAVSTSKYLLDRGYIEKGKKGRPTKEEKENRIKRAAAIDGKYAGDLERMGKHLN